MPPVQQSPQFKSDMARLQSPNLKGDELRQILGRFGLPGDLDPRSPFPIGIVVPDGVRVRVDLTPEQIEPLFSGLSGNNFAGVRSWRVFPIGIVKPEKFVAEIDIGVAHSAGG